MGFKNGLLQKGVTEQKAAYVTQGFLELLSGQLTLASEDAELAVSLFSAGKTDELETALRTMGQRLAEAVFSYRAASLLVGKDGDDGQIGLR